MARMGMMVLCVVMTCLVITAPYAQATIACGQVVNSLRPCLTYLTKGGPVPPKCCSGVQSLNADAKTTPDRQAVCRCLKSAFSSFSGINQNNAAGLPGKCGVNVGYKISPATDCTKVT